HEARARDGISSGVGWIPSLQSALADQPFPSPTRHAGRQRPRPCLTPSGGSAVADPTRLPTPGTPGPVMSKRPIKIATAQSRISADVRENGREIRALMRQARSEGATIVHFPEGAMSGCSKAQIQGWDQFDWDTLVDELHSAADLARELGLWVVLGS